MNIRDALLEVHSKAQATMIANFVGDDQRLFDELMGLMLSPVYRISQRAAWPVRFCVERNSKLLKPYFGELIKQLEPGEAPVAVRRNVLRLMQFAEIPKQYAGRIFDACYKLVDDPKETVAIRVFALTVAAKLAEPSPELLDELRLLAAKYPQAATSGFRSRVKRVLGI
ncbi:MAG: hypothetical protein ABI878_04265 [Acidobacteriota bacterium]